VAHATSHVHGVLHLDKGLLGLLKEAKDNGLAEFALLLVVVHLQDLLKGQGIDTVAEIRQGHRALFTLGETVSRMLGKCSEGGRY